MCTTCSGFVSSSLQYFLFFFFFSSRRRHTRFDCDWSSDVCSSDLERADLIERAAIGDQAEAGDATVAWLHANNAAQAGGLPDRAAGVGAECEEIGRASCRGRV